MKNKLLIASVLIAITLAACSGGGGKNTGTSLDSIPAEYAGMKNPLGTDAAAAGADVFKANCASCHGPEGHGDGPAGAALDPRPKNLAVLAPAVGDDYLYWRIDTGKEGTSMFAWKGVLTDGQIWQVIAFIRTLKP